MGESKKPGSKNGLKVEEEKERPKRLSNVISVGSEEHQESELI